MSACEYQHPLNLPAVINVIGNLDRCHAERLGQSNGCPCYLIMNSLPPQWTCIPPSCHNLSPTPNFIHHSLPSTPLNPDNDKIHSISVSNPLNDGAFDAVSPLVPDGSLFVEAGLPPSKDDVVLSQISSELDVLQWISSHASLLDEFSGWEWENKGAYNSFDGFPFYPTIPQPHDSSSAHHSDFAFSSLTSTHSGEGSPLENEHSPLTDDAEGLVCRWNSHCDFHLDPENPGVAKHLQMVHGLKPGGDKLPMKCSWDGCGKLMNKESISRHIVAVHLSKKTECTGCGKQFARWDSKLRHIKNSKRERSGSEPESHDVRVKRLRSSCPAADPANNDASSDIKRAFEPRLSDASEEIGHMDGLQLCLWADKLTGQICCDSVPAGGKAMLSHLNEKHHVCGSEKDKVVCQWAFASGSQAGGVCGTKCQRRNISRHIATHLHSRVSSSTYSGCDKTLPDQIYWQSMFSMNTRSRNFREHSMQEPWINGVQRWELST